MKAAMSGKEKVGAFGKEGSPTGESEIIQQKTGRWQAHKGAFWSRLGERGGKAIFNAATSGLTGGRAKDWQWSPEAMESQSGNVSEEVLEDIARRLNKGESKEHIMQSWDAGRYGVAPKSKALGGIVEGGPGQGVPTILHGGELVIPRGNVQSLKGINSGVVDILAGTDGQLQALEADINNYWMESKRARQDPQSDFMKFKLEVIGEHLPNTLSAVGGWYKGLGNTANTIANQTKGFGAGWTAAGLAAYNKYGVEPMTPEEIEKSKEDDDALDPNAIEAGWIPKSDKLKRVEALIAAYTGPPSAKFATPQGLDGGVNIYGPGRTGIDSGPPVTWGGKPIKEYTAEEAAAAVKSGALIPEGGLNNRPEATDMDRLEYAIQQQQRTGTGGYYGEDDSGDRTDAQRKKDFQADLDNRARVKAKEIEDARMADSLQKAREAIYGPEGGIDPETGEFVHGGLIDPETGRMKTLEQVGMNQATFAMTKFEAPAPKTEAIYDEEKKEYVRPSGEIMELAKRMAAQLNYIASFQQKIDDAAAIKRNIVANRLPGESTEAHYRRERAQGDIVEDLRRDRSRAEEMHTRMINQSVQDRLPYSLQEFQTRFPDEFPETDKGYGTGSYAAGGIVPGDIGEPQIVMAHGGETVSPAGMSGGRRGHTSNRTMNISINNASSVRDILRDLNDMESMDDASFFNSVT